MSELEFINGHLRSFTSVGGYPIAYVSDLGGAYCPSCADARLRETDPFDAIVGCFVNWETEITCDECGDQIELAYPID